MTRGQRAGFVTKAALASLLAERVPDAALFVGEWSQAKLLGHAYYYGLIDDAAVEETIPRKEAVVACYVKPYVTDAVAQRKLDAYAIAASQLYRRGCIIANMTVMQACGEVRAAEHGDPSRRFFGLDSLPPCVREVVDMFASSSRVQNGTTKHAFLPERWPVGQRDPRVQRVLDDFGDVLPPLPDWRGVMSATGWDNAINRMTTKLWGNVQVQAQSGWQKNKLRDYFRAVAHDEASVAAMASSATGVLRPLAIHDDDFEMLVAVRRALGVPQSDPFFIPSTSFTPELLGLHLLAALVTTTSSCLPVARRRRHFAYVDSKIGSALLGCKAGGRTVGELFGLTPEAFNRTRRRIRKQMRQRAARAATPSERRRIKGKMRNLGSGKIRTTARVQSFETDGASLRLVLQTPACDMKAMVRPVVPEDLVRVNKRTPYVRRKALQTTQPMAVCEQHGCDHASCRPIFAAIDRGRSKLYAAAISKAGWQKPQTVCYTRHKYYYDIKHFADRSWELARAAMPRVKEAVTALSAAGGGLKTSDLGAWTAFLAVERQHDDVLFEEFVMLRERADRAMARHRNKKGSLARAASGLLRVATTNEPLDRPLVLAVGDAKFSATGRGELPAPTASLTLALKRACARARASRRTVVELGVWEFRTTVCCCACGAQTEKQMVTARNKKTGEYERRRSRRLRSCTECDTNGKRRDRDVQAARNILWLVQHAWYGAERPWWMSRAPQRNQEAAGAASSQASHGP